MKSSDRRASTNGKVDGVLAVENAGAQKGRKGFSFMSYFADGHREVRRDELLGILEMLEYHRRENVWWKRGLRWLFRQPGPWNLTKIMADNFYKRSVKPRLEAAQALTEASPAISEAVMTEANRRMVRGGNDLPASPLIKPANDGDDDLPPGLHKLGETRE